MSRRHAGPPARGTRYYVEMNSHRVRPRKGPLTDERMLRGVLARVERLLNWEPKDYRADFGRTAT